MALALQNTSLPHLVQTSAALNFCQSTTVVLAAYPTIITAANGSLSTSYSLSSVTQQALTGTIGSVASHESSFNLAFIDGWSTRSDPGTRNSYLATSATIISGSNQMWTSVDTATSTLSRPTVSLSTNSVDDPSETVSLTRSMSSIGLFTDTSTSIGSSLAIDTASEITRSILTAFTNVSPQPTLEYSTITFGLSMVSPDQFQDSPSSSGSRTSTYEGLSSTEPITSSTTSSNALSTMNPVYSCPRDNGMFYSDTQNRVYQLLCDTEELDATIGTTYQADLQACVDACSYVDGCIGISYVATSGSCSYKSNALSCVGSFNTHSAVLANYVCPGAEGTRLVDSSGSVYQIFCDTFYPASSNITTSLPADDLSSCSDICSSMSGCSGFAFEGQACTLVSNRNADSGVLMNNVATAILLARRIAQVAPGGSAPYRSTSFVGSLPIITSRTRNSTPPASMSVAATPSDSLSDSGNSGITIRTISTSLFANSAMSSLPNSRFSATVSTVPVLASTSLDEASTASFSQSTVSTDFSKSLIPVAPTSSVVFSTPTGGLQSGTPPISRVTGSTAIDSSVLSSIRSTVTNSGGSIVFRPTTRISGPVSNLPSATTAQNAFPTTLSSGSTSIRTALLSSLRSSSSNSDGTIVNRPTLSTGQSLLASQPSGLFTAVGVSESLSESYSQSESLPSTSAGSSVTNGGVFEPTRTTVSNLIATNAPPSAPGITASGPDIAEVSQSNSIPIDAAASIPGNTINTRSTEAVTSSSAGDEPPNTAGGTRSISVTSRKTILDVAPTTSNFEAVTGSSAAVSTITNGALSSDSSTIINIVSATIDASFTIATNDNAYLTTLNTPLTTGSASFSVSDPSLRTESIILSTSLFPSITCSRGGNVLNGCADAAITPSVGLGGDINVDLGSSTITIFDVSASIGLAPSAAASGGIGLSVGSSGLGLGASATVGLDLDLGSYSPSRTSSKPPLVTCSNGGNVLDICVDAAIMPSVAIGGDVGIGVVGTGSSTRTLLDISASLDIAPSATADLDLGLSVGSGGTSLGASATVGVDLDLGSAGTTKPSSTVACSAGGNVLNLCVDATITPSAGIAANLNLGLGPSSSALTLLDVSATVGLAPSVAAGLDLGLSLGPNGIGLKPSVTLGIDLGLSIGIGLGSGQSRSSSATSVRQTSRTTTTASAGNGLSGVMGGRQLSVPGPLTSLATVVVPRVESIVVATEQK